jgi:tetratricopeptide (TPR) repeat protein
MTLNSERAVGNVYRRMKQTDMAIKHLQRVLKGREETFSRVHSLTTSIALDLASIYWDTDQPANAVVYYQQAFEGIQHQEPDSRTAGVVTMSNIGLCYYALKDYAQALSWYKKILTIQESEYGLTYEETICTAEQVARCCMETEEWVTAIEMFQRVIASKQKTSPDSPSDWSFNLFQLALACFKRGMYDESLTWSRRIINLGDKISPEERLATMRRMAVIFSKQANLEESLETYQKALDECKTILGDDHWLGKNILSEMGDLYLQMGSQTCAARDYQKILDGLQRSLDKDDFRSLKILYRFADVHLEQHRYQEALNLYIAVLDAVEGSSRRHEAAFTDLCNACVSDIATCHMKLFNTDLALSFLDRLVYCGDDEYRLGALVRIGNTQEKQGNYLAAIETYKQLLDLETAKVGASHRDPLMSVRKIAALYSRASKYQDALAWTNRALQGFRALGSAMQAETFETLDFLSSVYCHLGRFQDATRVQKEAMDGFARVRGPQHPSTLKATLDLAEMYRALERKEEANHLYQRALSGYEARVREVRDEGATELGEEQRVVRELKGKIREIGGNGNARR